MGKKGSSPKVSGYYKIDGDKVTREKKICLDVAREYSCQLTRTDARAVNVA